jgi:hypothetical protein
LRATAVAVAPGSSEAAAKPVAAPASLELGIGATDLALIAEAKGDPSSLSFSDAVGTLSKTSGWGLAPEPLIADVLDRLGVPFASFGTAIVGLLLGLRFRPSSPEIKRGFSMVSVPIIAALVIGAWRLIDRLDVVSSLWASRAVPGPDALWLSSGFRSLFILAGVILVAGATRPEGLDLDEGSPSGDE